MNSFSSEQSLFYFHKQYEFAGHPQGLGSIFGTSSQAFFFGIYRDRPLGFMGCHRRDYKVMF
jgi:hypothetical protein